MEAALDYAEQLLASNSQRHQDFRLEVVANDGGIELLRRDTSPFPQRIEALLSRYDNISFLACANALRKLRERGVEVELLPGTRSDHTAIDEIIERLEGGWRYLKV
jgi:intracellular sulfur oxidation DsrE/DsrF family protein